MKNIKEYINNINIDRLSKNEYFFNELKSIFGDNLSNSIIKQYNEYNVLDFSYIFENLKTHDSKKLQDKLLKEFSDIISGFIIAKDSKDKQSFFIKYYKGKSSEYKNLKNNEKFNNILGFFNYYVTGFYNINNEDDEDKIYKFMLIEPRYSDNVRDKLEKYHTRLYHFTDSKSAESIMKSGLRCKSAKYREFPERIFLWATNDKIIDKEGYLDSDIFEKIKDLVNWEKCYKYGLSCIRVDLYNHYTSDINIYSDTATIYDEAVFIYNNVPAKFLKEIKIKVKYE